MSKTRKRLGELLLEAGVIDQIQLNAALSHQKEWGGRLGSVLIRKGFVKETDMIAVIEKQMDMCCMDIEQFAKPSEEVLRLLREDVARKFSVMPIEFDGRTLVVATSDPTDLKMLDDLGFLLNVRIKPVLALESDIHSAIDHFYDPLSSTGKLQRTPEIKSINLSLPAEEFEIFRTHDEPAKAPPETPVTTDRSVDSSVLGGLIDLLVEKGIITRDELSRRISSRKS